MATKTRSKRKRQGPLPGMEEHFNQRIEDAASTYYEAMTERCRLSKEEDEGKDNLIDVMKEEGLDRYETAEGLLVTITNKSNVRCKPKKSAELNGDGEEEVE